MKLRFANLKDWIIKVLKEWGYIPMTEEELISKIPQSNLRYEQMLKLVKKMKVGENQIFNFDPRDPKYNPTFVAFLSLETGYTLYGVFNVVPRKGIYQINISVLE